MTQEQTGEELTLVGGVEMYHPITGELVELKELTQDLPAKAMLSLTAPGKMEAVVGQTLIFWEAFRTDIPSDFAGNDGEQMAFDLWVVSREIEPHHIGLLVVGGIVKSQLQTIIDAGGTFPRKGRIVEVRGNPYRYYTLER